MMRFAALCASLAVCIATSANAAPKLILPPPEYDHPYDTKGGRLFFNELRVDSVEALKERCRHSFAPPSIPLACAFPAPWGCQIVMVTDEMIRAAGYEPEHIRRHEIGHCNGWGSSHPDTRWTNP